MTNLGQKLSKTSPCHLPACRQTGRSGEVYVLKSGKEIPFRDFYRGRKEEAYLESYVLCLKSNILDQGKSP
jgi:hypothetical protein